MPDGYKVLLSATARRELEALHDPLLKRTVDALRSLSMNPRPHGCKKLVGGESRYRVRVGDHRVVYVVDDSDKRITVYRIRHRRDVYQ